MSRMILIVAILVPLITMSTPCFAQVEKRDFVTEAVGDTLGGAAQCFAASRRELNLVDCGANHFSLDDKKVVKDALDQGLESLVFQEVAQRSLDASNCQLQFLNAYKKNPDVTNELNDEAYENFQDVADQMHALVEERQRLTEQVVTMIHGDDPTDHSENQFNRYKQEGLINERISQINFVLKYLGSYVPMGDRPEILEALISAAKPSPISKSDFIKLYKSGMETQRANMQKSADFYTSLHNPNGTFRINNDLKKSLVRSGQIGLFLESIDPKGTLKSGLQCRLGAYYEKGPARAEIAATAALTLIPFAGEAGLAILLARAAESTSLVVRSLYLTTEITQSIGAVTGTAQVISQIGHSCWGPTYFATQAKTCDVRAQLNGVLSRPDAVKCTGAWLAAMPALANYKQFMKIGRAGARAITALHSTAIRASNHYKTLYFFAPAKVALEKATVGTPFSTRGSWLSWEYDDMKPMFEHLLGRRLNGKEMRFLLEHNNWAERVGEDGFTREQVQKDLMASGLFSEAERKLILNSDFYNEWHAKFAVFRNKELDYSSYQHEDGGALSLDAKGETKFHDLEKKAAKVEGKFDFRSMRERDKFFYFRQVSKRTWDSIYNHHVDPEMGFDEYWPDHSDPRDLVKGEYDRFLFIADNLGTPKMKNFPKSFGHADGTDANIYSFRFRPFPRANKSGTIKDAYPSYRALLCKQASGAILVLAIYEKSSETLGPELFRATEDEHYDRARARVKNEHLGCVNPVP